MEAITETVTEDKAKRLPFDGKLPDTGRHYWLSEKQEVLVVREGSGLRAYASICPHMGARLEYDPDRRVVFCPWHGLEQCIGAKETGHPRYKRIRELPVRVEGAELVVG